MSVVFPWSQQQEAVLGVAVTPRSPTSCARLWELWACPHSQPLCLSRHCSAPAPGAWGGSHRPCATAAASCQVLPAHPLLRGCLETWLEGRDLCGPSSESSSPFCGQLLAELCFPQRQPCSPGSCCSPRDTPAPWRVRGCACCQVAPAERPQVSDG